MGTEATPVDPRLTYNYSIEIDGLEIALCQKVNIPDVSVEKVEHNSPGSPHSIKTAGQATFDDITIEKVMRSDKTDKWAWDWLKSAIDPQTGRRGVAAEYKKDFSIIHRGPALEIVDRWDIKGGFPIKIGYSANDSSQKAEKTMENVTITLDRYDRP
jgi:phage tail-like protein